MDVPLHFFATSSLNRNVSSSTAHCKNAERLNLLQPATVVWSPSKATHGLMNSLTNHDTLYFPIQESLAGGQLVPCVARIPFVVFFFFLDVQLLCGFRQTFCQKCLENHLLQRGRVRELSRFVPGHTDGSQPDRVLVHEHSCAGRQAAGWHRRRSCVMLCRVARNQLGCC